MDKPTVELHSPEFCELFEKAQDGIPSFRVYLAGDWESADELMDVRSPIDLSTIARIPRVGQRMMERTLHRIHEKGKWEIRDEPGEKRLTLFHKTADLLEHHKDEFAKVLTMNAGKTRLGALGEVNASIERLRRSDLDTRRILGDYIPGDWSEETLETEAIVRREPIGTVLAIVPFNYPLFDTVNKLVYSTIVGNAIIIKPASSTPIPAIMLAKLLQLVGFPRHSFAVITMRGRDMGNLVADKRISGVSLTGSTETGLDLLKTAGIKQFVMELGGGDPVVVLDDAELPRTAQRIVAGITGYAGQRCDAVKLVLAEKQVYPGLKSELIAEMRKVGVGDPRDEKTAMGPLIDEETAEELWRGIGDAVRKGGKILVGGKKPNRNYIWPTLIEASTKTVTKMALYKHETFAAVALILPIESIDEALAVANGRRYGLDASVFGQDVNKIRKLTRRLDVGAVYVNDIPRHGIGYFPFGGRKDSGMGREGIGYTLDYVTSHKSIIYNYKGKGIWEYL